jgi:uncharacterized protein (DUF427 family)
MTTKHEPRLPGPDHPISVMPLVGRVRVRMGDRALVDTAEALELREASYPPVTYVPLADIDAASLVPSQTTTYCPYKGNANYYSVTTDPDNPEAVVVKDTIWYYATPYQTVSEIAGYAAFYSDKVQITVDPLGFDRTPG